MSVKVAKSRFILPSLWNELSQQFLSLQGFGKGLVQEAEIAQDFRHTSRLEELGKLLSNFSLKEYHLIGQYYLAWCGYRKGENTRSTFERVIEQSSTYKSKALLSLAAIETSGGDYSLGLKHYTEAVKYDPRPSIAVIAHRSIAVIKSMNGSHQLALRDLQHIMPLASYSTPKVYYDYLNSLAVELSETGDNKQAEQICRVVLASPFAFAYPEWRETGSDIALRGYKSRSVVSFTSKRLENVLSLPEREASDAPIQQGRARVLNYLDWKKKMVKEPNGNDKDKLPEDMSGGDIVMEILKRISNDDTTDEERLKILNYTINIISKRKKD